MGNTPTHIVKLKNNKVRVVYMGNSYNLYSINNRYIAKFSTIRNAKNYCLRRSLIVTKIDGIHFDKNPNTTLPYFKMTKKEKRLYHAIHEYFRKKLGKATHCKNSKCKAKNPKRFERALIKGKKYSYNIKDYIELCPSCHRHYDMTDQQRENSSRSHKGIQNLHMRVKIIRISSNSKTKIYQSVTLAAIDIGGSKTAISNCLRGHTLTSGGFKWKYLNK